MNREIKFRAWLEGKHDNMIISKPTMEYNVIVGEKGGYLSIEGGWDIHGEYCTIPIMQYTGLKDKNGKEIYEGDICQRFHLKGQVVYDSERAIFIIMDGFNEPLYSEIYGVEVIGNIYENPELLQS